MTYSDKLKSPMWQKKRLEIFERDNFTCLECGGTQNTLHVHHKSYKANTEPWDYLNENFITLCDFCHNWITEEKKKTRQLIDSGFVLYENIKEFNRMLMLLQGVTEEQLKSINKFIQSDNFPQSPF